MNVMESILAVLYNYQHSHPCHFNGF